jgi:hypothetical protein
VAGAPSSVFHCLVFHLAIRSRAEDEPVLLRVLIAQTLAKLFLSVLLVVSCVLHASFALLFCFSFCVAFFTRVAFLRRPERLASDGTLT